MTLEDFDPSIVRGNPVYQCGFVKTIMIFHSPRMILAAGLLDDRIHGNAVVTTTANIDPPLRKLSTAPKAGSVSTVSKLSAASASSIKPAQIRDFGPASRCTSCAQSFEPKITS